MMGPQPRSPTARGRTEQQGPHLLRRGMSRPRGVGRVPHRLRAVPAAVPGPVLGQPLLLLVQGPGLQDHLLQLEGGVTVKAAFLWGHGQLSPASGAPTPAQSHRPPPPRLTLGTKPGATFFSLRSCHSTPARDGAACMSCRLDARCLGSTVRSWNGAHVRRCPAPMTLVHTADQGALRGELQGALAARISRARQGRNRPRVSAVTRTMRQPGPREVPGDRLP